MSTTYLLCPRTKAAQQWIKDNLNLEGWQYLGRNVGIGHRYIGEIWQGITDAGMEKEFEVVS